MSDNANSQAAAQQLALTEQQAQAPYLLVGYGPLGETKGRKRRTNVGVLFSRRPFKSSTAVLPLGG